MTDLYIVHLLYADIELPILFEKLFTYFLEFTV